MTDKFAIVAACYYGYLDKRVSWEHFKYVRRVYLEETQ